MQTTRHIAVVSETYAPEINGVALTLARLVAGLRQRGHTVSVVRPGRSSLGDPDETCVTGVPLPVYRGLQLGLPATGVLHERWTIRRPDAVYIATEGPLGWSAVRTARRLGIRVLSGFHTNFHSYATHYSVGWAKDLVLRYLCAFHNSTAGTIVASQELREGLESAGVRNVHILRRGVDSELFDPARRSAAIRRQWGVNDEDTAMLYVGRVAREKNLDLAIRAYRTARDFDPRVRFIIVGDGPLRPALARRCPDVTFCGARTGTDLAAHYASADVFLFPSLTETFGNVVLEAMASGLVAVAFDYAAAREHVEDGRSGLAVPTGDADAFVFAALRGVFGDPALNDIRRNARAHAVALDWSRVVENFASLLLEETTWH